MPKVSVISIALQDEEFEPLKDALARQTFQDFEFIGEAGGTIPEAWNRAVQRARGDIVVFTETDATPVNEHWLAELVESVADERTIVKGLEVTALPWDMSNLAAHRTVFEQARFDESFLWAEDTEFFCWLKDRGYTLTHVQKAPVVHLRKLGSKRTIRRGFRYGLYWARLRHRYQEPIEVAGFAEVGKVLLQALLNLSGLVVGYLLYWPERWSSSRS